MPVSKNRRKKKQTPAIDDADLKSLGRLLAAIGDLAGPDDLGEADDALMAAQNLVYDAWETGNRSRRIALAKEALALSPDCADAYLLLAEDEKSPEKAIALYRQAMEAGERALGDAFEEYAGEFWGFLETRPYMRARHMLAMALWDAGEETEAVEHYQDMLRLNPNDNQGIRYLLIDALLTLSRDDDAAALLREYEEDGAAAWAWSATLLEFRRHGDRDSSRALLRQAVAVNRHVPAYLLGTKKLPKKLPDFIGFGDDREAVSYVHGAAQAWAAAPGALEWAKAVGDDKSKNVSVAANPVAPSGPLSEAMAAACEEIDDAVLALLLLGRHKGNRVWKGFDFNAMHRLHEKGYISDPLGKQKSVVLTEEGAERAEQLFRELFPAAAKDEL